MQDIITQLENRRQAIDNAISALRAVQGSDTAPAKKRTMSAAGRKRISEAMKARWAAKRATESTPEPKKSRFSAAARKRMRLAQQKRWAAVRAEEETAKKVVAKKATAKTAAAKRAPVKKVVKKFAV